MKRKLPALFLIINIITSLLLFQQCIHERYEPGKNIDPKEKDINTVPGININTSPGINRINKALFYYPDSLVGFEGVAITSIKPTVTGFVGKFYFEVLADPPLDNEKIKIDSLGVIRFNGTIPEGKYLISVKVTDAGGDTTFLNIFKLIVKPSLPTAISFANTNLEFLASNTSYISEIPIVTGGSKPFEFYLRTIPQTQRITIDKNSGKITVQSGLPQNEYKVTVFVFNKVGYVEFKDVIKINVTSTPSLPGGLQYRIPQLFINEGETVSSEIPKVNGTGPFIFSLVNAPEGIKIDSLNGNIMIGSGAIPGEYFLTVKVENTLGNMFFENVLHVKIIPPSKPLNVTYSKNKLVITKGNNAQSPLPLVEGTAPFTFAIENNNMPHITINSATGIIKVNHTCPVGAYTLNLKVSNAFGETIFLKAFEIEVLPTSFLSDISPIIDVHCGNPHCHPIIKNFEWSAEKAADIYVRINKNMGEPGFMPLEGAKLNEGQIRMIRNWIETGLNP